MRRTLTMRSFWSDPYLWVHLAGLASVPLWLELCLLGLAVGDPIFPSWLELFLVGTIGTAPIVWMQWQRPFNIFSLLILALKPEQLTENQRKLLTLFQAQRNRYLAVGVAIVSLFLLRQIYYIAPIAAAITPFGSAGRFLGLLIASIAFLGANLFLQVPAAVLSVLLNSESVFATTLPYPTDQIGSNFTFLGFPVNQVLPPLVPDTNLQGETVAATSTPFTPKATSGKVNPVGSPSERESENLAEDLWFSEDAESPSPEDQQDSPATAPTPTEVVPEPDGKADAQSTEITSEAVTTEEETVSFSIGNSTSQDTSETNLSDMPSEEAPSADSDPMNSL